MKTYLIAVLSIFISVAAQAGHHEAEEMKSAAVIGTVFSDDGTANQLLAVVLISNKSGLITYRLTMTEIWMELLL